MPVNKKDNSSPHSVWYLIILIAAGLCSFVIAYFMKGGVGDMQELTKRKQAVKDKIDQKRETLKDLKLRKKRLHQDPYLIEKLAKQRLGLGRPGEQQVKLSTGFDSATLSDRQESKQYSSGQ